MLINNRQIKNGFTLIELLIVLAIIGVLSTLLMTNFIGVRQRSRDVQRKSDLRQIQSALETYRTDNTFYPEFGPTGGCGWAVIGGPGDPSGYTATQLKNGKYLLTIPQDPNNKAGGCSVDKPGYLYSVSAMCPTSRSPVGYTIFTYLENVNDPDALAVKDAVVATPPGSSTDGNKTFTVTGGTCSGVKFNYWLNNR